MKTGWIMDAYGRGARTSVELQDRARAIRSALGQLDAEQRSRGNPWPAVGPLPALYGEAYPAVLRVLTDLSRLRPLLEAEETEAEHALERRAAEWAEGWRRLEAAR